MRKILITTIPLLLVAVSCQTGVTMWGSCSPAKDGNATGTDGTYALVCTNGSWEPVMTVRELVALSRGEKVEIAPLPTRPVTTSTTSTTSTTTTTVAPVDCSTAPAPEANLSGCDLSGILEPFGVNLSGANLSGADLSYNHVHEIDMRNADLTGANLSFFALHGGDLSGANLTDADLTGADLMVDLTGAIWSNTTCPNGVVQSTPCDSFY